MKKDIEMTTPRKYAERHKVHYTTVMSWLRRDLVPGVVKEELPYGGWYYRIPVDAPLPELKPGRPPKPDGTDKEEQALTASADNQEPAAPKRKASKRSSAKKASVTKSVKKRRARAK
jgi:hypothetical protein